MPPRRKKQIVIGFIGLVGRVPCVRTRTAPPGALLQTKQQVITAAAEEIDIKFSLYLPYIVGIDTCLRPELTPSRRRDATKMSVRQSFTSPPRNSRKGKALRRVSPALVKFLPSGPLSPIYRQQFSDRLRPIASPTCHIIVIAPSLAARESSRLRRAAGLRPGLSVTTLLPKGKGLLGTLGVRLLTLIAVPLLTPPLIGASFGPTSNGPVLTEK